MVDEIPVRIQIEAYVTAPQLRLLYDLNLCAIKSTKTRPLIDADSDSSSGCARQLCCFASRHRDTLSYDVRLLGGNTVIITKSGAQT